MKCPQCQKETTWEGNRFRPFCSERCKLLDLGNWAAERYRMPTKEQAPEESHRGNDHPDDDD
jgi:endogenous inhibitor of DNA gyrase (YacG/DUF329 family)